MKALNRRKNSFLHWNEEFFVIFIDLGWEKPILALNTQDYI